MEIKANKKSPNFAEHSLSFPLWIHSLSFFCQKSMMELSLSLFCWHTIGGPERVAERERESEFTRWQGMGASKVQAFVGCYTLPHQ